MNLAGLSDSVASLTEQTPSCPVCGTEARINGHSCVNCLLFAGLDEETETGADDLGKLLDEVEVRDTDWRLGNYHVLEEIGRGGMGVIYRARQRHSKRIVALKRVLSYHGDSRGTLERFRREAEAAASLDHPNILPIYEVSEAEGLPFFTMKYATGGSLQQAAPALSAEPRECVRLLARITRAVAYAHREGILHRDLKPGNILLDARSEPMVSDFGLAKWIDANTDLTRSLTIFGTPGYIAPEQAHGPASALSPAADVYSLGAILFDLLTGRPPFLGEHALAVIREAAEKSAPKLRTILPKADRDLETICAKCLEREPRARYRTAAALAEDLERWLEGRPIVARPISPPARLWRWAIRNPILASAALGFLLVGATAVVGELKRVQLRNLVRHDLLSRRSVAVLPMLDLDRVQVDVAAAKQMVPALQAALSLFGPARAVAIAADEAWVAGAANPNDIKEANRDARARLVIAGTFRTVKGARRSSIRVIDGASGEVLRTKIIEGVPATDWSVLVQTVVNEVNPLLEATDWSDHGASSSDPGMRNARARDFISSARQLMLRQTLEDYDRSIACLDRALEMEPDSALANAYLSTVLAARTQVSSDDGSLSRAEQAARRALQLDANSAEAHRSLAGVFYRRGRLADAIEEGIRAVETTGPEERGAGFLGMTLEELGEPGRALGWLRMAQHWAVMRGEYDAAMGRCWMKLGDDAQAESAYRRSIELRPEITDGWIGLCELRLLQGESEGARHILEVNRVRRQDGGEDAGEQVEALIEFFSRNYSRADQLYRGLRTKAPDGGAGSYSALTFASAEARCRQALGDDAGGRALLEQGRVKELNRRATQNPSVFYRLAAIDSCLGESESAFAHLRAAAAAGWIDFRSPKLDPRFDGIARDARFREFLESLAARVAELRRQTGQPNLAEEK